MKSALLLSFLVLFGCAADPQKLESVGRAESARLAASAKRFSTYADYELRPMVLSPAVQSDSAKVTAAGDLENALRVKIQPLLNQWRASSTTARSGTLAVEPQLVSLRIVSGGARFWVGPWAGDSSIDMDLAITDRTTGQQIAKPRITRSADAIAGGFSIGKSDQNLRDYIASIAYQYLVDNY